MRSTLHPYGGVNPLIDKMIGNAFDIVKYVACYLKEIRYVAENMEYVYVAANGNRTVLSGEGDGSDSLTIVPFEAINTASLEDMTAIAVGASGAVYKPAAETFNFGIDDNGDIIISIAPDVAELLTATYRVVLTSAQSS